MCSLGNNNPALVFGEGINFLPYRNFIASHSALTNVVSLSGVTDQSLQSSYPPMNSYQICNASHTFYESLTITSEGTVDTTSPIFQTPTTLTDNSNGNTNPDVTIQSLETTTSLIDVNNNSSTDANLVTPMPTAPTQSLETTTPLIDVNNNNTDSNLVTQMPTTQLIDNNNNNNYLINLEIQILVRL